MEASGRVTMAQELKVLGAKGSSYSHRVEVALKLKGLKYEFVEEDLPRNKSPLLLKSNPVYKKIPVLLHNGKPLAESLLIVEYIDAAFGGYSILPEDPYDRAVARFWARFIDDKVLAGILSAYTGEEEAREKGVEEALGALTILENELTEKPFFGGERIGYVDIAANILSFWVRTLQEMTGVELISDDKFPKLRRWQDEFVSASCVKETPPDMEKFVAAMKSRLGKKK